MANEVMTAKIRDALKQLDVSDNSHWTDDGLPRTGVVAKIAVDTTITRQQISAAWPGFQRNPTLATKPSVAAGSEDPLTGQIAATDQFDPAQADGELMTEDEVKEILNQRVTDAIAAETAAGDKIKEGQRELTEARKKVAIARADYAREFPPMTQAQNVKEYLAGELRRRAEAAGVSHSGLSGAQIDNVMQRSNSRGWRRPQRGARQTVTSGINPAATAA